MSCAMWIMTTNERIALALGWTWHEAATRDMDAIVGDPHWCSPQGQCLAPVPDYEHSLDALLEPLGVLRDRGWDYDMQSIGRMHSVELRNIHGPFVKRCRGFKDTPSEALALAVAEALEASK